MAKKANKKNYKPKKWHKVRSVKAAGGFDEQQGYSGTIVQDVNGNRRHILDVGGRCRKYADEIAVGAKMRNNGEASLTKDGQDRVLTSEQLAYRAGYLDHSRDSAAAYCSNNGIPSKAKPRVYNKRAK